jgi:RNA polymerase sigma-70 factor (ECF subfamily)
MSDLHTTFEQLYHAYYPRIYRRAYAVLKHPEQAEDATQETFLNVFRALSTGKAMIDVDRASGWLYRIATNMAINHLRSRELRHYSRTVSLEALPWEVCDAETADPQTRYEGRAEQVATTLQAMPPRYRDVLLLRGAGYSVAEIAERYGRTPRMVTIWLTQARAYLTQSALPIRYHEMGGQV